MIEALLLFLLFPISLIVSDSDSDESYTSDEYNCDYVTLTQDEGLTYREAIGVCFASDPEFGVSFRLEYEAKENLVYERVYESSDCSGTAHEIYPPIEPTSTHLGTGYTCSTYGYLQKRVKRHFNGTIISISNNNISNFEYRLISTLFGGCFKDLGYYFTPISCVDEVLNVAWFYDDECSNKVAEDEWIWYDEDKGFTMKIFDQIKENEINIIINTSTASYQFIAYDVMCVQAMEIWSHSSSDSSDDFDELFSAQVVGLGGDKLVGSNNKYVVSVGGGGLVVAMLILSMYISVCCWFGCTNIQQSVPK